MSRSWDTDALLASPLVATMELHDELGSTNDRARELALGDAPLPALVVAKRQTAGRGQQGRAWWSGAGSLCFSLALDPHQQGLGSTPQGLLSLAIAYTVTEAIRRLVDAPARIKWPNDVLLDGRKVAGVLIESPKPSRLVLGVGVNVATRLDDAPAEVRRVARSLADSPTTAEVTPQALLSAFLDVFDGVLNDLADEASPVLSRIRSRLDSVGEEVTLQAGQQAVHGRLLGVDSDGALLLGQHGEPRRYVSGSLLRSHGD